MDVRTREHRAAGWEFTWHPDGEVTLTVPAVTGWPGEVTVDGLPYVLDGLYEVPVSAVPTTLGRILEAVRGKPAARTACRERYRRAVRS